MDTPIPQFIKPLLWSYDFSALDLQEHKQRIITNVLNYGDKQATDWLRTVYGEGEIKQVLMRPLPGEWTKRSYNFWSLVYGISAVLKPRELFKR